MIPKTPLLNKLRLRWKCLKHCLLFASSRSLFARGKATPWSNPQLIWGCFFLSCGFRESYWECLCVPLEQKLPGDTSPTSFGKQLPHSEVEDAAGLLLRTSVGPAVGGGVRLRSAPKKRQASFLLQPVSPAAGGEEDGCVASALHRAVCFSVGVLDLISVVVARRSKTKVLKEMSDATGCVCLMVAE